MNRLPSILIGAIAVLAAMALIAIAVATGWGAVGRRIPELRVHGIHEFVAIVGLWLYFVGAAYATLRDRHIEAGLGYYREHHGGAEVLRRLVSPLVTMVTSLVIVYLAWDAVAWHLESGRQTIQLRVPAYLAPLSVVVGFSLIAVISAARLVDILRSWAGGRPLPPGAKSQEAHAHGRPQ